MGLKTSKAETETPVIKMAEMGTRIAARRAALGMVTPANPALTEGRNSGARRTESKKALLKAIEDVGGKW
jgi:hypothetical protein